MKSKHFYQLIFLLIFFIGVSGLSAQNTAGKQPVLSNLKGKKSAELEKVIRHYQQQGNKQKLQAAIFLINNMDGHTSEDFMWTRPDGSRLPFNELDYPDMATSLSAFNALKKTTKIGGKKMHYNDADTITSRQLIDNIELAFAVWGKPWNKHLSFEDFCEYILPYRVWTEPLQNWRKTYYNKYSPLEKDLGGFGNTFDYCTHLNQSMSGYVCTYGLGKRQENIPILGPLTSLHRQQGECQDMAVMTVYAMRAAGIPCVVDFCPYWPTSSGRHYWNVVLGNAGQAVIFMGTTHSPGEYSLVREIGKAYRMMYSKQPDALASIAPPEAIPEGFLRSPYIRDVSPFYGAKNTVNIHLPDNHLQYAFLSVFNYSRWQVIGWGKTKSTPGKPGSSVSFPNLQSGCVYLPESYSQGKKTPLAYPFSIDMQGKVEHLIPDISTPRQITLGQQDGYLIYRQDKRYILYYWDKQWKKISTKVYTGDSCQLVFEGVPTDALLYLRPEYSQGKERIFTVDDTGKRHWW